MKPWLFAPLALLLASCDAFRHVADCRRFVEATNAKISAIQQEMAVAPNAQVATYFNISAHYAALREELTHMPSREPQLERAIKRFAREVAALSSDTKAYAEAIQTRDRTQDPNARGQAELQLKNIRERLPRTQESYGTALEKVAKECAPSK